MGNRFKAAAVAFIAAIALAMCGARNSFAEDDDAGRPDANWEAVGKVLELPRACDSDGLRVPCDRVADSSGDDDDEDEDGNATASRGNPAAVPPTLDDDTASNQPPPNADWGSVDDYESESITPIPLGVYVARGPAYGGLRSLPPSTYPISPSASSNPLTPAATPPLGSGGPWMSSPSTTWGSPGGMMMPGRSFPSH